MRSRAPVIAVFTKNRTNDAYAAARLGAERTAARLGASVVHYVPRQPDSIEEQNIENAGYQVFLYDPVGTKLEFNFLSEHVPDAVALGTTAGANLR